MLTGPALGKALEEAIRLKGVPKAAVARHFDIKGPSIYDWLNHGRIGKQHLTALVNYFSDVVGPEHWGLGRSQLERLGAATILAAYREAVTKYEATGLHASSFKPLEDLDHAELLAIAIAAQMSAPATDSHIDADVEVGRGATRKDRKGSGAASKDRPEKTGGKAPAQAGRTRKSA